jgi:hypothetical protein
MMKNRRTGLVVFGTFMVLDMLAICWLSYAGAYDRNTLVRMKLAIFSSFVSDREFFTGVVESEEIDRFRSDPEELIQKYSEEIWREVGAIDTLANQAVPRAQSIVVSFSKNGGFDCGEPMAIVERIKHVSEGDGNGCCSDHSEVFLALSAVYDLKAREVSAHSGHVFNEFFDSELKKWIFIDPQYAIMATDEGGEYLSLFEMRDRYQRDEVVEFQFFGNDHHKFANQDPHEHPSYDAKDDFSFVMVTMGNNVFENDVFNQELHYLPKVLRQFIGMTVGPAPGYLVYHDSELADRFRRLRIGFFAIAATLVTGSLFYPTQKMILSLRMDRFHRERGNRLSKSDQNSHVMRR